MGYKTQNNYDEHNEREQKRMRAALPWRERHDWGLIATTLAVAASAGMMVWLMR